MGKQFKTQSFYPSHGGSSWGNIKPHNNKRKITGDFVIDNYTVRQARIIKGDLKDVFHSISKRDFDYIFQRIEKLNDEETLGLIIERYGDLLIDLYEEPYEFPKTTKSDLKRLLHEKAGF